MVSDALKKTDGFVDVTLCKSVVQQRHKDIPRRQSAVRPRHIRSVCVCVGRLR